MTGLADRRLTKTGRPEDLLATARPLTTDVRAQGTTCLRRRAGQTFQAAKPEPSLYRRHVEYMSAVRGSVRLDTRNRRPNNISENTYPF
jgi:hypothetical protein